MTATTVSSALEGMGVVIIGRNEGERLVRCLRSVAAVGPRVVYVDSGSTDDSVANARAAGAEVVALDMRRPFTAALARCLEGDEAACAFDPPAPAVLAAATGG